MVERLTEKDYDEALAVLNDAFNHKEHVEKNPLHEDFEKNLPIMWTREHDYMSRHFAIRENGKIVSLLGVYPIPTMIAGEKVLIGTIGNVGSLANARGKGYMKQIMIAAIEEARNLGFVAARLGGFRSRYNRYGFDHAGMIYQFYLTRRNVRESNNNLKMTFTPFVPEDTDIIAFARTCHQRSQMYVIRETTKDFYYTLCAWENRPYLVKDDAGNRIGYISISKDRNRIAEIGCIEGLTDVDITIGYMNAYPYLDEVIFPVIPFDKKNLQTAFRYCEDWLCKSPSMFRVFQWDQLVYPLMKIACANFQLTDGNLVLGIKDWGNLHIRVENNIPTVSKTDKPCEILLSHMEATNWLLGNVPAVTPLDGRRPESTWFPLPLSWNELDRV